MSGIAAYLRRDGAPAQAEALAGMLARLASRGPDGQDTWLEGPIALGHRHLRALPEEAGERQPLRLAGLPFALSFDGRLDNRAELLPLLASGRPASEISDAALALLAYARWGEACLGLLLGEFALALWDGRQQALLLGRDPLGERSLFYALEGRWLAAASEPWAVLGCPGVGQALDETALALYYAGRFSGNGRTCFRAVSELPPGSALWVSAAGARSWRYWQPDPERRLRLGSDGEYAAGFLELLEQAVNCRLRASAPAGILLSGGLDSAPAACLAAKRLAPQPLTALSYVFDELAECDERSYIEQVSARYGLRSIYVPCDDAWPLKDWEAWPPAFNWPEGNPYRLLKERAYGRARQEGLGVLLSGASGDLLYSGAEEWLADLLAEGRLGEAWHELHMHLRAWGPRGLAQADFMRRLGGRLLDGLPWGRRLVERRTAPPWLTPSAARRVEEAQAAPALRAGRLARRASLWDAAAARGASGEAPNAARFGLELRDPYRDRRLVEFMLAAPAHQFYRQGRYKTVMRNAMKGILPEELRTRRPRSRLTPLYVRGFEREEGRVQAAARDEQALWRGYVRPGWYDERWLDSVRGGLSGAASLLPWICVAGEAWWKNVGY